MKATLEFELPDENESFLTAVYADITQRCIDELRENIRTRLKHGAEPDRDFVEKIYQGLMNISHYNEKTICTIMDF